MINRTAKFDELIPSTLPFVEGKMQGHKDRKNFSIVGPGVAEDSKQFVKISKAHGFNLGAVIAKPKNGSGLHSHTTSEVFLMFHIPFSCLLDDLPFSCLLIFLFFFFSYFHQVILIFF